MYQCRFCGYFTESLDDFEEDTVNNVGFWCPYCDGFTYYQEEGRSFILYLEDAKQKESYKKVSYNIYCSPLRYPGGKSRLIGLVHDSCRKAQMHNFIEPFAGGASVGLALLLSGHAKELYLNDADYGIYALFSIIKVNPDIVMERINSFVPSKEAYEKAKQHVLNGYKECTETEAAWSLLVTNRLAFSGIPFANCMSNPSARWNAKTLCKRIEKIHRFAEHIHLSNKDALEYIEEMYWLSNATMFIDPPYYEKGNMLYPHAYAEEDHLQLSFLLENLHKGFPGADIIVTYDKQKEICDMYGYPKKVTIGRKYSIAN